MLDWTLERPGTFPRWSVGTSSVITNKPLHNGGTARYNWSDNMEERRPGNVENGKENN